MTAATLTTTTRTLESQDPSAALRAGLLAMGFDPEQVAMLESLKQSYSAFSEHFESDREFRRLSFLKWQYENGQIERG